MPLKLYSPKQLAKESTDVSARWIRDHGEEMGFVKQDGKWLALEDNIKLALKCSTKETTQSIGMFDSSTVERLYVSPLAARIKEMRKSIKNGSGSTYNV